MLHLQLMMKETHEKVKEVAVDITENGIEGLKPHKKMNGKASVKTKLCLEKQCECECKWKL